MKVARLENFTRGWFIGAFSPTLCATEAVEVSVRRYQAGDREAAHYHRVATEHTVIVEGSARMRDRILLAGDIATLEPGEIADFEALTALITVVVKLPGARNDKYPA